MSAEKSPASDHAPFLFMGVLCWLCGAVFIAIVSHVLLGDLAALLAVVVVTILVLAIFWRLGTLSSIHFDQGGRQ